MLFLPLSLWCSDSLMLAAFQPMSLFAHLDGCSSSRSFGWMLKFEMGKWSSASFAFLLGTQIHIRYTFGADLVLLHLKVSFVFGLQWKDPEEHDTAIINYDVFQTRCLHYSVSFSICQEFHQEGPLLSFIWPSPILGLLQYFPQPVGLFDG